MTPEAHAIPLNAGFRFVHEPLDCTADAHLRRFVGRGSELDELVARIILSDGGAFLVTGYRGVGKSTFVNRVVHEVRTRLPQLAPPIGSQQLVDVHLNVPRAMESVELMYHVLRGLYRRLSALDLLDVLDPALRRDLDLAFSRTSRTIALKTSNTIDNSVGLTLGAPLPLRNVITSGISLGRKRTRGETQEIAYLAYDDKAAEYDLVEIARRLSRGFAERRRWPERARDWMHGRDAPVRSLKVLLVFDELDKIDDSSAPGTAIDAILANLKTLFTTSGIAFLFVAGKDIHERWLEDVGRGDSIYESVFSYALYLPPLWAHADPLCDPLLDRAAFQAVSATESASAYAAFKKFLAFNGRGIPRRMLRKFNERVRWGAQQPELVFSQDDIRQFRFFADLYDVLLKSEASLLGELRDEALSGRTDRKRLGLYYLVDWILLRGVDEFTLQDAVAVSRRLSRLIAPAEEAAPAMIGRLLTLLAEQQYLDAESPQAAGVSTVPPSPESVVRYRITHKRLVEMGSLAGVVEPEAQVVINQSKSERFGGRYDIVSVLGRGGMATVFLVNDRVVGRQVAIKEQLAELGEDPEARERFRREVQALSRLQHENVVRIYDVNAEAKQPYIVMEYIEGVRLTDLIGSETLRDEGETLRIAHEIVRTLEYIHDRSILWRDAKPSNVMITPQGRVVLLDFGISHVIASTDAYAGMILGTPSYSSPEQLRGEPLDARSDLYGLGIVLYQMVTGRLPFDGDSTVASAYQRINDRPPPPSSLADVSEPFEAAILKCLEPDKAHRFASATAMLDALPKPAPTVVPRPAAGEKLKRDAVVQHREEEDTSRVPFPGYLGLGTAPPKAANEDIRVASLVMADGSIHELQPPLVRVGRGPGNDIVLQDSLVSRFHAELSLRPDGWTLKDQNSRNTTALNGTQLTAPVVLRDGDVIEIGETPLVFRTAASAAAVQAGRRVRTGDLYEFLHELRTLAASAPIEAVIERGLDRAIVIGRAERGFVMTANEAGELVFRAARARGGVALPGTTFGTSQKIPREVFTSGQIRVVSDLLDEDLARAHSPTVALGIRHVICVPLSARTTSEPIGVVYLDSRERGGIHSSSARDALQILSVELADIIKGGRLLQDERERVRLEQELRVAAAVQRSLQPKPDVSGAFYQLASRLRPCVDIGGDFCQHVALDAHHVGVCIGDVSGKGTGASLLASFTVGSLDASADAATAPSAVLGRVNKVITTRNVSGAFVTVFYGVLSDDGTFAYTNGGHVPPFVFRPDGVARLETGGLPVGLIEGSQYADATLRLSPGDLLVAVSDGVTEALNEVPEEFGEQRLADVVRAHPNAPARTVAEAILESLDAFRGGSTLRDDASVLVLRYTGVPQAADA